jgi:hypothetical protein
MVSMKITAFWDVTSYNLVYMYRRFGIASAMKKEVTLSQKSLQISTKLLGFATISRKSLSPHSSN